jgi:hypothetical protein
MLVPLAILLILGWCYAFTIAPDITWSHFSADGGDLITAVATGGVPHPSGYPLYLILARLFQFIPLGTLAFRTNLFSAVCTILTALVLYAFLIHPSKGGSIARPVSFFAALTYGLAPLVWGQALVTEVYALHGLLMIVCLYVLDPGRLNLSEWTRGLIFGLAAANHLTSVLIFPLLLLNFQRGLFVSARVFLIRCGGILSGLMLYLVLPLRAYFDPPVNWGDTSTFSGFIWLVSGQIYHDYLLTLTFAEVLQRLSAFAGLLLDQYTWIGVLLAIYGLLSLRSRRIQITSLWMGMIFLLFALLYGSKDSQVNLLPVWLVLAIWLAYGLRDLCEWFSHHFEMQWMVVGSLFALLLVRTPFIARSVDVSDDRSARDFIDRSLAEIPRDALVFVDGDEETFSLFYAQFALHLRLDIIIVSKDLLAYGWYTDSLRRNYPQAEIPENGQLGAFDLVTANPDRVVCYISDDISLSCVQKEP